MTVMFCDLVGSTSLAERVDPEDLRDLLIEYHKVSVDAIERYGGHLAKYMGDGMVVYFGYPHAHEDDPRRAVHAGLELLAQLRALNERLARQYEVELHARVGIHTGLVVAGEMGCGQTREELAITGETPTSPPGSRAPRRPTRSRSARPPSGSWTATSPPSRGATSRSRASADPSRCSRWKAPPARSIASTRWRGDR